MYDGRDLYLEILNGEEWRVARNLHEIISCLPDFIENTKQAEDAVLEQEEVNEAANLIRNRENVPILTEVYGRYCLDEVYDMRDFQITRYENGEIVKGKHAGTSRVFYCKEQDIDEGQYHDRKVVITRTCFMIFALHQRYPSFG